MTKIRTLNPLFRFSQLEQLEMDNESPSLFSFRTEAFQKLMEKPIEIAIEKAVLKHLSSQKKELQLPQLLTKQDIAKLFKVSQQTVNDWMRKGTLPFRKINSRVYFEQSKIMTLINDKQ